jgi:DNA-binding MarR family transcriptional regulator
MRLIHFFSVMRRSGVLAQRRVFGMSEAEWRILTQVGAHAPLSLNRLAELTLQDRGQLSRTVKGMVERGLLNRERRPGGPTVDISLAPAGRELHARMIDRALQRDQRLTQDITPADDAALRRIVEQMITRAEEMLEEERALS